MNLRIGYTHPMPRLWMFLLVGALSSSQLDAQKPSSGASASIHGRVIDHAKRVGVAGATVRVKKEGMDAWSIVSDPSGEFGIPSLSAGRYLLEVEATGFLTTRYNLLLRPRQSANLSLELVSNQGPHSEVQVTDRQELLEVGQTGSARLLTGEALQSLPAPISANVANLVENLLPGAVVSHDNFLHFRGNELSLHQFLNGVSFLDNPHQHFSPGLSPHIFQSVDFLSGGFPAEYGNRFGGVLDIVTRSGRDLGGHGRLSVGAGNLKTGNAAFEYGQGEGRWGYYLFAGGFKSGRFLNPPTRYEINDFGQGGRFALQVDYQGDKDSLKLLLTSGGSNFQLPNTVEEAEAGRDAFRKVRSQTAILSWDHVVSPRVLVSSSLYERLVSDRLLPTSDLETPLGQGSRGTLTVGAKTDILWNRKNHTFKAGWDVSLFRLNESFVFLSREDPGDDAEPDAARRPAVGPLEGGILAGHGGELEDFSFRGGDLGGELGVYIEDHYALTENWTLEAGLRWDQLNLVGSESQLSPRVGIAWHIPKRKSTLHFAYNRLFVPPPLEYPVLASYLGNLAASEELEEGRPTLLGNVRPYTQHFFEAGWAQQLNDRLAFKLTAYRHTGENAFETAEISNTRLFLPQNFNRAAAAGIEASLQFRRLDQLGVSGYLNYAAARIHFEGPGSGGFPGEELEAGERITPAFDQTHTGSAGLYYRSGWRRSWGGINLRYGSGTPLEREGVVDGEEVRETIRLDQHLTADISAGLNLWEQEDIGLDLEFDLVNVTNEIYRIAKESESTPIQFSPRRMAQGRLVFRF